MAGPEFDERSPTRAFQSIEATLLPHVERDFDLRKAFPDYEGFFTDWRSRSAAARAESDVVLDVPYGPGSREVLDFFPARTPRRPLVVFIHGGYWRAMDKFDFSFVATPFVEHDINVALVNYPLSPEASISEIVERIRVCCLWLHEHVDRFAVDHGGLHLIGWSAGAHLAAMMATIAWPAGATGSSGRVIRSVYAISGIYDLYPVRHTSANAGFRLDHAEAQRNSPLYRVPQSDIQLALAWGATETPSFRSQSRALADAWSIDTRLEAHDRHHYAVMDELANRHGAVFKTALALVGP